MIKKIPIQQLTTGMYVHDLNCGWMDHDFITSHFLVQDESLIERITRQGIKELYIDTDKGVDTYKAKSHQEVQRELQQQLDQVLETPAATERKLPAEAELSTARLVQQEASKLVVDIMEDVRLGKQIEVERVHGTVEKMVSSIFRNKDALLSLGRIRRMDQYTFEHSLSVTVLMLAFARELGLERSVIDEIGVGALLHDIGKIKIPPRILNKPGRLDDSEFKIVKSHVVLSREILKQTPGISPTALAVAAEHHERYDGSGYPDGLKGDEISHAGQMAAIVDVYDAICADRCYHKGQLPTQVLQRMLEWSKFHFNEELVHAFIRCVGIYPVGTLVHLESGRLALVIESGDKGPLYPVVRVIYDTNKQCYIVPCDLDLSHPGIKTGSDRILHSEPAGKWKIPLEKFLT